MTNRKETTESSRPEPSRDRHVYAPPTMKEFGPVGTLTQGGTGMYMEGNLMLLMVLNRT